MGQPQLKPDGSVAFESAKQFRECYSAQLSQGTIAVATSAELAAATQIELMLEVPGGFVLPLQAEVAAAAGGEAELCLTPFSAAIQRALKAAAKCAHDEAAAAAAPAPKPAVVAPAVIVPAAAPVSSPTVSMRAPAAEAAPADAVAPKVSFAAKGSFINPKLPQDFLSLPIVRPPTAEQIAHPPLVAVLMWLITRKSEMLLLKVATGPQRSAEITIVNGEYVLSAIPTDAALKTFAEPTGTYEVVPAKVEPKVRYNLPAATLGLNLLREYTKRYIDVEYSAAMSARHGQSPRMTSRGKTLTRTLGLSDVQQRIANRMLTGQYSLDEVLNNGVGQRSSWQMVFQLQVLGGLDWVDPPPRQNIMIDEMTTMLGRIKGQDHFTAMGLHLSSSPKTIQRTYERLRVMYGPGSPSHKLSAKVCEEIWAHMEKCYKVIGTADGRREYRKTACAGIKLDYQARLVYDQARLAIMRGEREFAIDQMDAVLELCPTAEFQAAMQKMGGGSPH